MQNIPPAPMDEVDLVQRPRQLAQQDATKLSAVEEATKREIDRANARLAIAEEIMRRYPDEFEQQGSTRLLGVAIAVLAFGVVAALILKAEGLWFALGF
ncbi:hypothetical protein LB518_17245 [Mesorhizobium sp. BR1-1-16]|uniref:hypothetical protein n=1 Tax=Mesorhizobium sp. BR1-1-16 TaxID=2876653 RepID=UPI001CCEC7B5|nr:hypothetical protein [Mesorhizobium sp. BR1-1-16]MBZ9938048.1 hypothetical protein [Mesorhizobium sp. BR1-1-16]